MKIYIDVSKIKIFQMELLENFMAKNDIEYARIYTIESIDERDKEIERLQRQKEELQVNGLRQETLFKLEIERLNNIIKRLEEFIEREIELYTVELTEENKNKLSIVAPIRGVYKEIYNVLQELKGSNDNG